MKRVLFLHFPFQYKWKTMIVKMYLATLLVSIGVVMSSPMLDTKVDGDNVVIDINLKLNLNDLMKTKNNVTALGNFFQQN